MADVTGSAQLARKVIINDLMVDDVILNDVIPYDVIIPLCIIMIIFHLTVWQDVVGED